MENIKYVYDASTKIASVKIGEETKQFTFENDAQVKALWDAAQGNAAKFAAFASISNKLDKVAKVTEQSAAVARWESDCVNDPAIKAKYAQSAREMNTALAGTATKYAIENVKAVAGQGEDGTFRFTAKSSAKFDAMIAEFDAVRVKNEGEGWAGSFDCPELYKQVGKAIALQIEANSLVDARKPKDLATRTFRFDPTTGKMIEKGGNGTGGSTSGHQNAIGYKVAATGTKYDNAKAVCDALKLDTKGNAYPQKCAAFLAKVNDGTIKKLYKQAQA